MLENVILIVCHYQKEFYKKFIHLIVFEEMFNNIVDKQKYLFMIKDFFK